MRIVFVLPTLNLKTGGGSPLSFHLTASELSRRGYDVRAVCLNVPDAEVPKDVPYPVRGLGWRGGTRLKRERALARVLEKLSANADVIHLYDSRYAPSGGLYRRAGGDTPVVVTLNNYFLFCSDVDQLDGACQRTCGITRRIMHAPTAMHQKALSVPGRLYETWIGHPNAAWIDRFLPVSPAVQRIYGEAGFDMRRSTVITDVIDLASIQQRVGDQILRSRPAPGEPFRLLFAGRLIGAKGADVLVDALPSIQLPVHLHLAGEGPTRDALQARVSALGLEDRVTFHGWLNDEEMTRVYRQIHAFIHPCRYPEPCSRSVLEALAGGVPTIVSDVGGTPWIVDGYGRTFRTNDPQDLARKVTTCLEAYDESVSRASDGVQRAAQFDAAHVTDQLVRVYEQVVSDIPSRVAS